jgi:hypothetical protein
MGIDTMAGVEERVTGANGAAVLATAASASPWPRAAQREALGRDDGPSALQTQKKPAAAGAGRARKGGGRC